MRYIKYALVGLLILVVGFITFNVFLFPVSPLDKVTYSYNNTELEVQYSRPYKKGRLIFGLKSDSALVPFNEYWRTGANYSTDFSVSNDIKFGGKELKNGKYWLYTIPNPSSWKVFLNEEDGSFGFFEPDKTKDVLEIEVSSNSLEKSIEQFTIYFVENESKLYLRLKWDTTEISIPIE